MAGEETVARATIQLGADGSKLSPEMAAAVARAQAILDGANKKAERAAAQSSRAIQREIDRINAVRPTREMGYLEAAVKKMGGTAALTQAQLRRITVEVNSLASAGAKVPTSLANLTGMGSKLSAAFTALTTGGGISGALAAIGPAGIAAAAGVGALSLGLTKAYGAVSNLAQKAETWGNVSMATGISVETVQKLSDYLIDAGFDADTLERVMKSLQTQLASGGKDLAKYGINIKDLGLASMDAEGQLRTIAQAVMGIEDPMLRGAAATEIFGKSGAKSLSAIAGIAQGAYKDLAALTEKQVSDLQEVDKRLDELARAYENFAKRAIVALLSIPTEGQARAEAGYTRAGGMGGVGPIRNLGPGRPSLPPLQPIAPEAPLDWNALLAPGREQYRQQQEKQAGEDQKKRAAELLEITRKYNAAIVDIVQGRNQEAQEIGDLA